ncbi:MAG: hypothetical protein EOP56_07730 [Sphingobacteriales bacterium]|nr:MAG: hypothetical protein EOP56_07730 [Sphingobacteriales bacterium]
MPIGFFAILIFMLALAQPAHAQYVELVGADTSDKRIKAATNFLVSYLKEFNDRKLPDYSRYWSKEDCKRSTLPDNIVYSISDDYPTYQFCKTPTIFYALPYDDYVHLKTLFYNYDSSGKVFPWAITNHYVALDGHTSKPYFISELELKKKNYKTVRKRNIIYHFPALHRFDRRVSKTMLKRLEQIEQDWGFKPVPVHYYFADNPQQLTAMRGMDYVFAMDEMAPNGISYPQHGMIFSQGMGEGYLHEVLHMYFNPAYPKSPMTHALVYYYGGGIGHDFDWIINRMARYLTAYPDTDLTNYVELRSKDKMLHISHTVNGLLLKMIDKKDGVAGLKRALTYATTDELLKKEFGLEPKDLNEFLRKEFGKYASNTAE